MAGNTDWSTALSNAFTQVGDRLLQYLPAILVAFGLLLVGWLAARLLRAMAIRLAQLFELMILRLSRRRGAEPAKLPPASGKIFASIVFWVVILFFLTAAAKVLGLDGFLEWLNRIVAYLPTLLVGGLIVLAGYLVGKLVRDVVVASGVPGVQAQRVLLGRIAQTIILVTAIVIGADQVGIKITFLVIMATVIASTLLGGAALAVSLGAKTYVQNLIGAHYLRQTYQVGQSIRIGHFEGKILEVTPINIVLETVEGRATLPARMFNDEPSILLSGRDNNG